MKNGKPELCQRCGQPAHWRTPWRAFITIVLFLLGVSVVMGICGGIAFRIVKLIGGC